MCLFFQLFAAIFSKFIFRVELEMLLGKRRTQSWYIKRGANPVLSIFSEESLLSTLWRQSPTDRSVQALRLTFA